MSKISEICKIILFNEMGDERGNLVVIEGEQDIPFSIKRVFYLYGSDKDIIRGQHANRRSSFLLVNVSGTSKVYITDGCEELIVSLDKPRMGVYIPPMYWKDMYDFSADSVLLVLSDEHYDSNEYIRDYHEYLQEMALMAESL